ncbi:efflux RND transporter periplasmic adaptor subunit [Colwellia sp. 12G3]|uniref:efflux RND transporter periplasmic adaptor subunit n=1 Tax=Colwellia sp. 12G3 TaxID=2058299 RepID=UPI000C31FFB3|nr:efflux RND transporter periplasmic adaptor subunit [Colwellia sp. 12G3]PKI15874.1 efflux RND transporter periplasmic adaptor subunit [Colwellia sp. 12G3]
MNTNNTDKNNSKKSATKGSLITGIVLGAIITLIVVKLLPSQPQPGSEVAIEKEDKPLYWVAPMDANYQRDKPGKSPMGMDLIPYYDNQSSNEKNEGAGTIKISPSVINNLGVRTTRAKIQSLQTKINTVGYVTYDEDKLVHIHPRVQGWVDKLFVKSIGEPVVKGQPLYKIYSPELVNAQEELLLALNRKNERLITAAQNRLVALQLPQSAIDELKQTRKVQQNITFFAPQNGVIENLNIREGFFVKPGSTLMSIGDLSQVWVKAEVFERQAGQVKQGTPITMTLDYLPGKVWQGHVDFVYPTLEPQTRTVKVRLRFSNENGQFKPNMFAQITIHSNTDEKALLIPKEALIRTGNQDRVVLALGEGYFKSIAVTVGRFDSKHVEIISGLSENEIVVSSAQFLLDSESSKTSDFQRMDLEQHQDNMTETTAVNEIISATVHGTVTAVMTDHRMVTIDREAIEKWNREPASVDFIVGENVDMTLFTLDAYLMFTFEIQQGEFVIVSAMTMTKGMSHQMPDNAIKGTIATGASQ